MVFVTVGMTPPPRPSGAPHVQDHRPRLVLAGAALSFIGNVSAAPARGYLQPAQNYMSDRHNPTDTNGF
jgi:hypothetical protein